MKRYLRSFYSVLKQRKLKGVITALLSQAEFSQLIRPLGARPLVLSAHPGDDIMAMGGTFAAYLKRGTAVTSLTFTAGRHGTNTGKLDPKLGPRRKKELVASYATIGEAITPLTWDLDENFKIDDQLEIRLLDLIDEFNPDIIYAPSLLDNHPDSQAISRLLGHVLAKLPSTRLKTMQVAQYELWTPLVPNKILNIDAYAETKQKAIECHESQLLCRNYLDAMMGLNRYRAAILGAGSVAESFFICSALQYLEFMTPLPAEVIEMVG